MTLRTQVGAFWTRRRGRAATFAAGLFAGGVGCYLIRPSLPFAPEILVGSLSAAATVGAVLVALFVPWAERHRKARAIRVRLVAAINEVDSALFGALQKQESRPQNLDQHEWRELDALAAIESLASHFEFLSAEEIAALLDLGQYMRKLPSVALRNLANLRPALETCQGVSATVRRAVLNADASAGLAAVPPRVVAREKEKTL